LKERVLKSKGELWTPFCLLNFRHFADGAAGRLAATLATAITYEWCSQCIWKDAGSEIAVRQKETKYADEI